MVPVRSIGMEAVLKQIRKLLKVSSEAVVGKGEVVVVVRDAGVLGVPGDVDDFTFLQKVRRKKLQRQVSSDQASSFHLVSEL